VWIRASHLARSVGKNRKRKGISAFVDDANPFAALDDAAVDNDNDDDNDNDSDVLSDDTAAVNAAVYGAGALPRLSLRGGKKSVVANSSHNVPTKGVSGVPPNGGVALSDVQALLLWLVADGVAPAWCAVVNKALVPRVVCLALQGLTVPLLTAHGAACMPFLNSLRWVRTHAPGETNRINSPLPAILERPLSAKQLKALGIAAGKAAASAGAPPPPILASAPPGALTEAEYGARAPLHGMTRAMLVEHGFPWPLTAEDGTTTPQDNACVGYVRAEPRPPTGPRAGVRQLVAIDCEMVLCDSKYCLAWLAVTSCTGEVLVDTLVKPHEPVTDYLTQWSGVSAEKLAPVTTTLEDARAMLLAVIDAETFICGHSLENDLHALALIHGRILDTSVLYPRGSAAARFQKHALRYLTNKFLNRQIQTGDFHTPSEDAIAAMELAQLKLQRGAAFGGDGTAPRTTELIFAAAERAGTKCTMIDRGNLAAMYTATTAASAIACETDAAVLQHAEAAARSDSVRFVWAQMHALGDFHEQRTKSCGDELDAADAGEPSPNNFRTATLPGEELERTALLNLAELKARLTELDSAARAVYNALPPGGVLIMPSLQGNAAAVKRWHARKRQLAERKLWSAKHDVGLERLCIEARDQAVTFFAVRDADAAAASDASSSKKLRLSTAADDDNDDNDDNDNKD
jgi:RNA exonuclease 1